MTEREEKNSHPHPHQHHDHDQHARYYRHTSTSIRPMFCCPCPALEKLRSDNACICMHARPFCSLVHLHTDWGCLENLNVFQATPYNSSHLSHPSLLYCVHSTYLSGSTAALRKASGKTKSAESMYSITGPRRHSPFGSTTRARLAFDTHRTYRPAHPATSSGQLLASAINNNLCHQNSAWPVYYYIRSPPETGPTRFDGELSGLFFDSLGLPVALSSFLPGFQASFLLPSRSFPTA